MASIPDLYILGFFILVLLGIQWGGYYVWIRPHGGAGGVQGTAMLLLIILTMSGGFIGAFSWWMDIPGSFAWDLPPLAGRMLGVAGWCFAFAAFMSLQHPSRRRVRLVLLMLAVYLTPLLVALLLFHLQRLDFAAPITYAFLLVVILLSAGALWFLLRQPIILSATPRDTAVARRSVRVWLVVVAVIVGLWGVALFLTDQGPSGEIWAWPGDGLTNRLIAAMLMTIAVSALLNCPYADVAQIMLGVTWLYGMGLGLASAWNRLAGKPIKLSYLVVFGAIGLGSAVLLLLDRPVSQPANRFAPR
jgi:hypothetical protein